MSRIASYFINKKLRFLKQEFGLYDIVLHNDRSYEQYHIAAEIYERYGIPECDITFKFRGNPNFIILTDILKELFIIDRTIPNTSDEIETIAVLLEQIKELNEEIARLKDD